MSEKALRRGRRKPWEVVHVFKSTPKTDFPKPIIVGEKRHVVFDERGKFVPQQKPPLFMARHFYTRCIRCQNIILMAKKDSGGWTAYNPGEGYGNDRHVCGLRGKRSA